MKRKIIQISSYAAGEWMDSNGEDRWTHGPRLFALCDDGSLWQKRTGGGTPEDKKWTLIEEIPEA